MNKYVLFKFSVTMGGIKWVMFVMILIGGGREGKRLRSPRKGAKGWDEPGQARGRDCSKYVLVSGSSHTLPEISEPAGNKNREPLSSFFSKLSLNNSSSMSPGRLVGLGLTRGFVVSLQRDLVKDVLYVNDANSHTTVLGQATYLFNNRIMAGEIVVSDNATGLAPVSGLLFAFAVFYFYNSYCLMKGNYMNFCLEN